MMREAELTERDEGDLTFELKSVCDLPCSILPFAACKA